MKKESKYSNLFCFHSSENEVITEQHFEKNFQYHRGCFIISQYQFFLEHYTNQSSTNQKKQNLDSRSFFHTAPGSMPILVSFSIFIERNRMCSQHCEQAQRCQYKKERTHRQPKYQNQKMNGRSAIFLIRIFSEFIF